MKKYLHSGISFIVCLLISQFGHAQSNVVPDAVELAALQDLYDDLEGTLWTNKTSWPTVGNWPATATATEMDAWYGITVINGDITAINLSSNKLKGVIPATIGNLTQLGDLYLQGNQLSGEIPATIGNLKKVGILNLSQNQLSGPIPPSLGSLPRLFYLLLQENSLSGAIPKELGLAGELNQLVLTTNKLKGPIPPELGDLGKLATLNLGNNQLFGSIPPSLGKMAKLVTLQLHNNQLTGKIPAELGKLGNLQYLYLNMNQLTDEIPPALGSLNKLVQFIVYTNQLQGGIPATFAGLTKMSQFYVYNNKLSGLFPSFITGWTTLGGLQIYNNNFSGPFPEVTGLTFMTGLNATGNSFTSIPASILTLPILSYVQFENNQLTYIPDFSTYSGKANLNLHIRGNRLDFYQLEPLIGTGIKSVGYMPLNNVNDISAISLTIGSPLVITARPTGNFSTVSWEKQSANGQFVPITTDQAGNPLDQDSNAQTYTRTSATTADEGVYRWKMTNTKVTGVTLYSDPIIVKTPTFFEDMTVNQTVSVSATYPTSGSYKLVVGGDMLSARLVLKAPLKWPDYVFSKEYELPSIESVDAFINNYGHLPDLMSAEEMNQRKSYSVAKMDVKLLEKIEELTLYAIELNDRTKDSSKGLKLSKIDHRFNTPSLDYSKSRTRWFTLFAQRNKNRSLKVSKRKANFPFQLTPFVSPPVDHASIAGTLSISPYKAVSSNYKVVVGGNAIATGIDIKPVSEWPDYVFDEDYSLPTLKEVNTYIQNNHHLPGLPSAQQMSKKENYSLNEMDARLLEKIEELTLYTIQLNKQLAAADKNPFSTSRRNLFYRLFKRSNTSGADDIDSFGITNQLKNELESDDVFVNEGKPLKEEEDLDLPTSVETNTLCISCSAAIPSGFKLAVGGTILAAGVDVKAAPQWPDYVFAEDYHLLSLDEVKKIIEKKGHLPNVMSAHEMEVNEEYDVAQMDAKLLEKIEECTLYLIELDQQILKMTTHKK